MDIWKVSERTILTIQRILRVSPEPRFVSSVSWHRAIQSANATFVPAETRHRRRQRKAQWDRGGLPQYDGKRVCRPRCRISIRFRQALWCRGGAFAPGDRIFNRLDRMFWSRRGRTDKA